jgi:hypothetical protein
MAATPILTVHHDCNVWPDAKGLLPARGCDNVDYESVVKTDNPSNLALVACQPVSMAMRCMCMSHVIFKPMPQPRQSASLFHFGALRRA